MDLYLQFGHGMQARAVELTKKWNGGNVIFSPKNMTCKQMISVSEQIRKNNGNVLIDPQFYIPRTSRKNLVKHSFWPKNYTTNSFFDGSGTNELIDSLINEYLEPAHVSGVIIPTLFMSSLSDDWRRTTERFIETTSRKQIQNEKFLTICIDDVIINREDTIHELLEELADYPVQGFYIIPKHPNDSYLVEDVSWLLNLMDFCAGLKLLNKKVLLGYSGHQFILFALAKIDAICAGTWLKTRMFPLNDFEENENEQEGGRRSTWYYCPQALTEYQIQYLDIAYRLGILRDLKVPDKCHSSYSEVLFSGAQPTTVNFSERDAFRHYLTCLKFQCEECLKESYEDTKTYLQMIFETANELTSYFRKNGIRGKHRDFNNVAETTISLLDAFDSLRGLVFKAKWDSIL